MKRTEPLILTVRFLVFDREPYRTQMGNVTRFYLRTTNRSLPKGVRFAVHFAVLKYKRYGSLSNIKKYGHRDKFGPSTVMENFVSFNNWTKIGKDPDAKSSKKNIMKI